VVAKGNMEIQRADGLGLTIGERDAREMGRALPQGYGGCIVRHGLCPVTGVFSSRVGAFEDRLGRICEACEWNLFI